LKQAFATSDGIEQAIVSSIAYRDVFDFAVTLPEIHRFLHHVECSLEQMTEVMIDTDLCHGRISTDRTYYCLKGSEASLPERYKREAHAEEKLLAARAVGRLICNIPNVRMVALSGSLAARNSTPGNDLDIFCVSDQGKLWRTRALVLCLRLIDNKTLQRKICPNFFLSTAALELDVKSYYIAHELAQMVPMYGLDVYTEMRKRNAWADAILPNARGAPDMTQELNVSPNTRRKAIFEWALKTPFGAWFETFESTRKIRKFNTEEYYCEPHGAFTPEKTGQRLNTANWIEQAWKSRLEDMGISTVSHQPIKPKTATRK
jgi:hypothetical protein